MHTGKEQELRQIEKGRLNCDSDAPQVGSAWSDFTGVIKVNRHTTNCHKTRSYCISVTQCIAQNIKFQINMMAFNDLRYAHLI
jgi:hypothetical protein